MFTQKWRDYWGLSEDPFTCEDADKDAILTEIDPSMAHWSFDRMYGNPRVPAPGIVFGEKGSGKSALRLMMVRRIEKYNQEHPDNKIFLIEYIDFNNYLQQFRRAAGIKNDQNAASKVMNKWSISDHLDSILSVGVSKLVDEALSREKNPEGMKHKEKAFMALQTALYYQSPMRTRVEAVQAVMKRFGLGSVRPFFRWFFIIVFTILGALTALTPLAAQFLMPEAQLGPPVVYYAVGLGLLAATWVGYLVHYASVRSQIARANRAIKVLPKNPAPLSKLLERMSSAERKEYVMPIGSDDASRYQQLQWFMTLLHCFGYRGLYVLIDRVDEPSILSAREELMRTFIEKILDIKLLQFPDVGLKLFLPIELDEIHRNASPEQLKKMRLDKSNLVPELKWSGNELYEIANQRMISSLNPNSRAQSLADLFASDFDMTYLKETLNELATPRYAFGFLSNLLSEYIKNLPNDLEENDEAWKIDRHQFDVVKSGWLDKTGILRRVLN